MSPVPSDSAAHPAFTVVIATYDRGPLIAATLESVAAQSFRDFEVLVVSDGPAAEGLADTVASFGPQFTLHETPKRSRSQSGPNNFAWAAATAAYIAYLGHDDIWNPHHLQRLADEFAQHAGASFAVSGCVVFGPPGGPPELTWITGLFDSADESAPREHFFPPSSFAHLRELPVEIPRWGDAATSGDAVDVALLKGAAAADLRFASTGVVTVYKFSSAMRYLSYLYPADEEQRAILERTKKPAELDAYIADVVERARPLGAFMPLRYAVMETKKPGEHLDAVEHNRGIARLRTVPLRRRAWIGAGDDSRGVDWYAAEPLRKGPARWRWSGPSAYSRLRLPVTGAGPARVTVHIGAFASIEARESLTVFMNDAAVGFEIAPDDETLALTFVAPLRPDRESVIEFRMELGANAADSEDPRRRGFSLLGIAVEPAASRPGRRRPELKRARRDWLRSRPTA